MRFIEYCSKGAVDLKLLRLLAGIPVLKRGLFLYSKQRYLSDQMAVGLRMRSRSMCLSNMSLRNIYLSNAFVIEADLERLGQPMLN
jgi:hypothetical protein